MERLPTPVEDPCPVCELGADGPCSACNGRGVVAYVGARPGPQRAAA